jgi:formamidopyrimidine-DNA glycosylase
MPELPEVETTRLGIAPHLVGATIRDATARRTDLRYPIPTSLLSLAGPSIIALERRSKYLLFHLSDLSTMLVHLGMSGSLRLVEPAAPWRKHDHFALTLSSPLQLRYHDPRRFGLILHYPTPDLPSHPLLAKLGPEPLGPDFHASHLKSFCKGRQIPIKQLIMDASVVVGVGNIYASESLFHAAIHPKTRASHLSKPRLSRLVDAIRSVLEESIATGGTTLRDFVDPDGNPGYFRQRLHTYGRAGQPCRVCSTPIRHAILGQRATYWCPACQKR